MNEFEKHFEKLAKTDDASTLWINWLDWVIDQNLIINHDRKLNFKGNEKMYFQSCKMAVLNFKIIFMDMWRKIFWVKH